MIIDRQSGFSLVELTVVIGMIAIFVGIVAWNVNSNILEYRLQRAFDDVAVEIKGAQAEAILAGDELLLRYDFENNAMYTEAIPELKIQDYIQEVLETRRRSFASKSSEEPLREFFIDDKVKIKSVYVDDKSYNSGSVPIFLSPDGFSEPHRILLVVPDTKSELVFESRGFTGQILEVDSDRFDEDFEDADKDSEVDPYVIKSEDFFPQGFPDKLPQDIEGS